MRKAFAVSMGLAATALTLASAAAADLTRSRPAARPIVVSRIAAPCPPLPALTARGRRGVGEPGTFYGYWDWAPPRTCIVAIGR